MTAKNTRHCVNSISMLFVPKGKDLPKVIKATPDDQSEGSTPKPADDASPGESAVQGEAKKTPPNE